MPIRCRTLRSFLEYWVFSATERLFPSKGALESDSRTGPDWIAPERRDYRNVAQVAFGLKIPHSDKTSRDLASKSVALKTVGCPELNASFKVYYRSLVGAAASRRRIEHASSYFRPILGLNPVSANSRVLRTGPICNHNCGWRSTPGHADCGSESVHRFAGSYCRGQ